MTIKITIGSAVDDGMSDAQLAQTVGVKVRLDIRKTLGGDLIISDHPDIDIVIIPGKNKILALAKQLKSGVVYGAQNRLFEFLQARGLVFRVVPSMPLWRLSFLKPLSYPQLRLLF